MKIRELIKPDCFKNAYVNYYIVKDACGLLYGPDTEIYDAIIELPKHIEVECQGEYRRSNDGSNWLFVRFGVMDGYMSINNLEQI